MLWGHGPANSVELKEKHYAKDQWIEAGADSADFRPVSKDRPPWRERSRGDLSQRRTSPPYADEGDDLQACGPDEAQVISSTGRTPIDTGRPAATRGKDPYGREISRRDRKSVV